MRAAEGFTARAVALIALGAVALTLPAAADASFPGSNGRIAYEGGDGSSSIYAVNPDGTGKVDLTANQFSQTNGTAVGSYEPAYSADGERIALSRVQQGVFQQDIWVMNADGSGAVDLTPNTTTDRERYPSFSPDGSKIAYVRQPDGGGSTAIYVMNANGSSPTDLTSALPITFPSHPEFSPDGSKIAFDASNGTDSDIYVMNANGSGLTNVTSAVANGSSEPSWSPDGSRIAFTHVDALTRYDIFVIGSSGGATTNLTSALPPINVDDPAFSPDGTRIAYTRTDGMDTDIFTMGSTDGLGQTNLTTDDPTYNTDPSWSPLDKFAPAVAIGKGPKKKTTERKAKFTFAGDEAGVNFECMLTGEKVKAKFGKFKECSSPKTYRRLKAGKTTFEVRGTDPLGNVGKATKFSWKIKASGK